VESLIGSIITCAEGDDVLLPKSKVSLLNNHLTLFLTVLFQPPSQSNKKGNAKKTNTEPQVHTPKSLDLSPIARRQRVLDLCDQDVTFLVDADTSAEVISF